MRPEASPFSAYCHSPLQYHFSRRAAIVEKREHMFLRAMSKAMRYYRVWIYSCNVALFLGTLIYLVAFLSVIGDWRLNFITSIRLYQPSFIYSYFAIIIQGGLLQALGCIGALKLNERYLNIYLMSIFVLLFGDGVLGIVWLLRYDVIITNLRSDLKLQITRNYENDPQLQDLWNELQTSAQCCGVDGPLDFNGSTWAASYRPVNNQSRVIPLSCLPNEMHSFCQGVTHCIVEINEEHVYNKGCYELIFHWLQSSANLLSVLGFCIITFVKMCFLCLLRTEIKEMIDKIRVIKGQTANTSHMLPFQDLEAYLPRPSMQQETLLNASSTTTGNTTIQGPRSSTITEKCHCRLGVTIPNSISRSGSRMILSTSSTNLSGCVSKKHSLV